MFAIFRKKSSSVDELVAAYHSQVTAIAELEIAKTAVKDEAIQSSSPDLDAVAKALDRLDLEISLHQQAQSEIRSRLENLIRQQLTDAKDELTRRRPELEEEIKGQYFAAGQMFQELVDLLQVLPAPLSGVYRDLQESIDGQLKRQAGKPETEAFAAGMQSAEPPEHNYRAEWDQLRPATLIGHDPQAGFERKIAKTLARLLGEQSQHAGQPGCFGLGVK